MAGIAFSTDSVTKRNTFLHLVFDEVDGYVCVARIKRDLDDFKEMFFRVPQQWEQLYEQVNEWSFDSDVYFCPMIFNRPKRVKEAVETCHLVWADLDGCNPELLKVKPWISVQTSPGRFQALWRLSTNMDPFDAEAISRRIAYYHEADGADTTGWDLTQLLRVPFTANWKYVTKENPSPEDVVVLATSSQTQFSSDFADYPEVSAPETRPVPLVSDLPYAGDAEQILNSIKNHLDPQATVLYSLTPETGRWSDNLFKLYMFLFEAGLSAEETFAVTKRAACNKWARDGRNDLYLWKDVLRAYDKYQASRVVIVEAEVLKVSLLSDEERELVAANPTIIEEYVKWAKTLGDAAWQYHQVAGFVCLSSLLAGPVRLPTSFGTLVPNLWFMILADTTLTRKTTAMDIAMDIVVEIDSDVVLATDGSIEGLFTSLATRPGRPSVFLRDEFSGLLEMMGKKDYYAGMAETLTKLYDGKYQKRVLRRETIEVKDPVLILFAGGIKDRILGQLTYEHVASGFLPRFIFVSADSDIGKLKPLGPPTEATLEGRYEIVKKFAMLHNHYTQVQTMTINGKTSTGHRNWDARLTQEAWQRYNDFEAAMLHTALQSFHKDLVTPVFDRLSKTGLKLAVLLAAARHQGSEIVVELLDILQAISYIENWRIHSTTIVNSIGRSANERLLERILTTVRQRPGVLRSELMLAFHLTSRDAEMLLSTLDQRGQLNRIKSGRTEKLISLT